MKKKTIKTIKIVVSAFLAVSFIIGANIYDSVKPQHTDTTLSVENAEVFSVNNYTGEPYIIVNNNEPEFTQEDITTKSYEEYGELDFLGRCTYAIACVGNDVMPKEDRGNISSIRPSGWHSVKYNCVEQEYLYNRCHLIAFQLTGENANEKNLITGTRYLNVEGMLPFENEIADYVKETNNHVLYKVTPIFNDFDLIAQGIHMEAISVEDNGKGVKFNVFCFNVQPGITIDYATGNSYLSKGG